MGDEITVNRKWALSVLSLTDTSLRLMASYRTGRSTTKKNKVLTLPADLFKGLSGQNGFYDAVVDETVLRAQIGQMVDKLVITSDDTEKLLERHAPEDWENISLPCAENGLIDREALTLAQLQELSSLEAKDVYDISRDTLIAAAARLKVDMIALSMHLSLTAASREETTLVYGKSAETKVQTDTVSPVMPKSSRKSMFGNTVTKANLQRIRTLNSALGDLTNTNFIANHAVSNN